MNETNSSLPAFDKEWKSNQNFKKKEKAILGIHPEMI